MGFGEEVGWGKVPVYRGYDAALCEGGCGLVLPEAVVSGMVTWRVEGIVESRDKENEVRQPCGDLVEQDRLVGELLAAREGVVAAA